MKVSIIIPTAGRYDRLITCLESLVKHSKDLEIIVSIDKEIGMTRGIVEGFKSKLPNLSYVIGNGKGFSSACNLGASKATGDILIFLNDDTIVSPNWTFFMYKHLYPSEVCPNPAIVGPVSNFAGGAQMKQLNYSLENFDEIAMKFHKVNENKGVKVIYLSGFCMMVKKEVFDELGGFDTRFDPGGFEDNDFVLRAYNKGYDAVLATDVYIHHFGSSTIGKNNTLTNWKKFHDKWKDTSPKKVVGVMRVLNGMPYVKDAIRRMKDVCDEIVVLDNGSTDGTLEFLKESGVILLQQKCKDEVEERNLLTDTAASRGADWVLSVDADEVLEDAITKDVIWNFTHPVDPATCGYSFPIRTFWRGHEMTRLDGVWGGLGNVRLFRVKPNFKYIRIHPEGLHCSAGDYLPKDSIRPVPYRFKHYGYDTYEKAKKKYEYYNRIDRFKNKDLIGTEDYSHLIDETNLHLEPWREKNRITLAVNAKDSEIELYNMLKKYYTLFHKIVVGVDTRTTDRTREVAELFKAKVVPIKWQNNYAKMRNDLLKECKNTEWIFVMDTDEDIEVPGKVPYLIEHASCDAWVFYFVNYLKNGKAAITENPRLFRKSEQIYFTGLCHETVEESLFKHKKKVLRAPFSMKHYGFLKETLPEKLALYEKLNKEQIKVNPNDPRPYFNLALHYVNDGNDEEAEKLFIKALELKPNFVGALINYASLCARKAYKLAAIAEMYLPPDHVKRQFVSTMKQTLQPYAQITRV